MKTSIEVSARHIHLSTDDANRLFGYTKLTKKNDLSQSNNFAAEETIDISGVKNNLSNVRVIGPCRAVTQLEITISDAYYLGIDPPEVLVSGDLEKSSGNLQIIGKKGKINLNKGVIVAKRHLHINKIEAEKIGINDRDNIKIRTKGKRPLIFEDVTVRVVKDASKTAFQIDTDEANAAGVKSGDFGEIIL